MNVFISLSEMKKKILEKSSRIKNDTAITVKEINMLLFILLKSIFTFNNTFKIENK